MIKHSNSYFSGKLPKFKDSDIVDNYYDTEFMCNKIKETIKKYAESNDITLEMAENRIRMLVVRAYKRSIK